MNKSWIYYGFCPDGSKLLIDGFNVWDYEWQRETEEPKAEVRDPLYQQQFSFPVYRIETERKKIRFAAGEFSNCMWGFYVQK
jgi:hypothetical protein